MTKYHVDPYLVELINGVRQSILDNVRLSGPLGTLDGPPAMLPNSKLTMLLRVRSPKWRPKQDLAVEVLAQIGPVVAVRATVDAANALMTDPDVLTMEASRVGGIADGVPSVDGVAVNRPDTKEQGDGCLIAVIDSGFDVLHGAFRGQDKTRIAGLWDQADTTGPSPQDLDVGEDFFSNSRGTVHIGRDIETYWEKGQTEKRLGRDASGHGTHVASIAAGRAVGELSNGMAPSAPLLLVIPELEKEAGQPASIGYSVSHVEALQFIDWYAKRVDLPVVVNLSSGMNAGAHDGTSLLETAFDEFTNGGRAPGRVIVKSAGNEQIREGHARVSPIHEGTVVVDWESVRHENPSREDYFEAWYDSGADLEFVLMSPDGSRSEPLTAAKAMWQGRLMGNRCTLTLRRFHVDNGDSCLQIRLEAETMRIAQGVWRLEIYGRRVLGQTTVDIWVERTERVPAVQFGRGANAQRTLTIPGTSRSVITVGAFDASELGYPILAESSYGPTRDGREKPEFVAPGVNIRGARAGTQQGSVGMTGTSMAAPHVSGLIALLLSACKREGRPLPNAQQLRAALTRTCGGYTASWHEAQGYGRANLDFKTILDLLP